jgi:hypothetical protein
MDPASDHLNATQWLAVISLFVVLTAPLAVALAWWCKRRYARAVVALQRQTARDAAASEPEPPAPAAYLLKEEFQLFWEYDSPAWAARFLDAWCKRATRSRIEPVKRFARTVRTHRELLLNDFRAKKQFSSGVIEGLNNKAKVTGAARRPPLALPQTASGAKLSALQRGTDQAQAGQQQA